MDPREFNDRPDASAPLPSTERLQPPAPPLSKGKEIMEADPHPSSNPTPQEEEERCGICLTGATHSIPGQTSSCNHHFCYVCIMEWAKIESRCPLCKQQFDSIRRPPVPGLLPAERVVKISERHQVYHPLGIESSDVNNLHLDPNCSVCHSSGKDAYLLLCELCNSTFHTHCVGQGFDIPEGEWYCPDCTVAKNEYLKTQPDDMYPFPDQETKEKIRKIRRGGSSVSVNNLVTNQNEESIVTSIPYAIHRDARTYRNYHRMECIQRLRENWERLRSGQLEFSSQVLRPNIPGDERRETRVTETDVSRAWKMLDKARSTCADRGHKKPSQSASQSSKNGTVHHKFQAHKHRSNEIKGKGVSATTNRSNPATALCNNGRHGLSNQNTAQGSCNEHVGQSGPIYDGLYLQGNPDNNQRSQTNSGVRVSGCVYSDMGNRREIGMVQHLHKRKVFATSDGRYGGKDEVRNLVKLQLKALDKDKKLGTSKFKEIARISTHTILAAYGMEHSKSVARPSAKVSCTHHGEIESHVLPGSCQNCFNIFLQRTVETVFSEISGRVGAVC